MMRALALLTLLAAGWLLPAPAQAAVSCSVTGAGAVSFGPVTSIDVSPTDLTQSFTITCSALNSDIPGSNGAHTLNLCVSYDTGTSGPSLAGNRQLLNGTNIATYDLYTTNAYSGTHWGSRVGAPTGIVASAALAFTKANNGGTSAGSATTGSITVYARLFGGQTTLPFGTYSSTLNQRVESFFDTNAACGALGIPASTTNTPQLVTADFQKNCRVGTISNLNFGNTGFLASNVDSTTSASVTCTSGTTYTIALNAGTGAGATTGSRKMTRTAAPLSTVSYGLYRDSGRTQNWGNAAGTDTQGGTGTGSAQAYTIYGRVPPQNTPEPGNYQDTIVLTVAF